MVALAIPNARRCTIDGQVITRAPGPLRQFASSSSRRGEPLKGARDEAQNVFLARVGALVTRDAWVHEDATVPTFANARHENF